MKVTKIVLCGLRCTGKTTLFWNLQKELSWPMFSVSQFLRDYIRTYHVSPFEVEEKSQEITAEIDARVDGLLAGPSNVLIESRVFHKVMEPIPGTLKLLLTASDGVRIKRSSQREQTDIKKAEKRLFKKELEFVDRMSKIYKIDDLFKPDYFDLVIQTDNLSPEQVMQQVLHATAD